MKNWADWLDSLCFNPPLHFLCTLWILFVDGTFSFCACRQKDLFAGELDITMDSIHQVMTDTVMYFDCWHSDVTHCDTAGVISCTYIQVVVLHRWSRLMMHSTSTLWTPRSSSPFTVHYLMLHLTWWQMCLLARGSPADGPITSDYITLSYRLTATCMVDHKVAFCWVIECSRQQTANWAGCFGCKGLLNSRTE